MAPLPAEYKEVIDLQIEEFGELWVEDILAANNYGELRFRIPLAPFCSKVSAGDTHAVTVTVADKRSTGRLIFSGFADACAGTGDDNGDAMESELFSGAVAKAPAAPAGKSGKKAKKKGKKKKKKKKKKRKKR